MKLLWLCNVIPGKVHQAITGAPSTGGLWVDSVLDGLTEQEARIHIHCRGGRDRGQLDDLCSYALFQERLPYVYLPELEDFFAEEIRRFQPDAVHIWGTEFGHTLAMMRALERQGLKSRGVISIQGLCSLCAGHYAEGLPDRARRGYTFRDFLRRDNVSQQQAKFVRRGELEIQALKMAEHVIGRTDWDRAAMEFINPRGTYHHCNETLRKAFYQGQWTYDRCRKHRIFAGSCSYPVKGFHYLLEAMALIARDYPDVTLAVPGDSPLKASKLRRTYYQKYLGERIRTLGLEDRIEFLGSLQAEQMKQAYLEANVFALPSTIENSPNSLGEAMLLGLPCVAAQVGGVGNFLVHGAEGFLYQSTAAYMLAYYIKKVFAMENGAEALGRAARTHASETHHPEKNLSDLMGIYQSLAGGQ